MSMKLCKDCGTEVSKKAKTCPKCGRDQRNFFIKHKFITFMLFIVIVIIVSINGSSNTSNTTTSTVTKYSKNTKIEVTLTDFSSMNKDEIEEWCNNNKINYTISEEYSNDVSKGNFISQSIEPNKVIHEGDKIIIKYSLGKEPTVEQKNALKQAESYSENLNMSKQAIYDQLTSQYGGQFSKDDAQYAIDNLEADWNKNALEQAKSYQNNLSMSKKAIYDQLISKYGGQFTKSQAQYAIDHLDD